VLAGTYQRVGGVMRVSVQLIDHGAARWGGRYDLQGDNLLRFEDDVAQKVVDGLSVQLSGAEQANLKTSSTDSAEAYDLLLEARAYYAAYFVESTREPLHSAQRSALRAIEKDPAFVDAYSLLAEAYTLEATNFQEKGASNLALAEQAARKALALNPHSYEAHMVLGGIFGEQGKIALSLVPARQELGQTARRCRIPAHHGRSRRLLEALQRTLSQRAFLRPAAARPFAGGYGRTECQ
jgi:tetratricopeptide (TPR) repeat protein